MLLLLNAVTVEYPSRYARWSVLGRLDPHLLLLGSPGSCEAALAVPHSVEGIRTSNDSSGHSKSSATPLASLSLLLPLHSMFLWLRLRRCSHLHRHLPQTRCLHCFRRNHLCPVLRALGLCFLDLLSEGMPPPCCLGLPCTACLPCLFDSSQGCVPPC